VIVPTSAHLTHVTPQPPLSQRSATRLLPHPLATLPMGVALARLITTRPRHTAIALLPRLIATTRTLRPLMAATRLLVTTTLGRNLRLVIIPLLVMVEADHRSGQVVQHTMTPGMEEQEQHKLVITVLLRQAAMRLRLLPQDMAAATRRPPPLLLQSLPIRLHRLRMVDTRLPPLTILPLHPHRLQPAITSTVST